MKSFTHRNGNPLPFIFYLITAILISGFYLQAQTQQSITGLVVESETLEPLQYANVILFTGSDSTQASGSSTDIEGNFRFENINDGQYYIKVSFIGFEDNQTPVFAHRKNTHIGKISINKSALLLDEINITGEKSTLNTSLDKKVYNVGKDISSVSGSVSDILQNVPSVSVDLNGKVTLRGSSNITFLINGRPSSQLRRNAPTRLQQIPANTIERIEVITNPSAKYDPHGAGGIINIIQRENYDQGLNGQVIENIGNERRFNTSFILNYGDKKVNAFTSYSFRHANGTNIFSDDRTRKDSTSGQTLSLYNESGSSTSNPLAHIIDAGMTYQFDEENNIEIAGSYFLQNTSHEGSSDIDEVDSQNQPLTRLRSENTNDELESEGEAGASFEHLFNGNEDHSLAVEVEYANYSEREDLKFDEFYNIPGTEFSSKKILVKKSGNQIDLISEYAQPLDGDTEFETGYSVEIISDDIFYLNNQITSKFLFDQTVHGIYALVARDIENFNIELGLRAEQTFITSDLVEPTSSQTKNDYFKLYPSVRLTYEFEETRNISLSYSKRINRPDADQLNPFPEFTDPRNAEAGNPNLDPEQIHSMELGYQMIGESITIAPTLFYRYKSDAFTSVSNVIGDSLVISTIENLANQQSGGMELIVSGKLQRLASFDLSTSLYYDEIDGTNIGYSDKKNTMSGTVKLYSLFNITSTTFLQLNLNYDSPVLTPQGQKEEIFYINAGVKQLLLNNQVTLTFTVSDMLSTYKERLKIDSPGLIQSTNLHRKEPVFYFGFLWRFGESFQSDEQKLEFEEEGLRKL